MSALRERRVMSAVASLLLLAALGGLPHLWLDDDTACPPTTQASYQERSQSTHGLAAAQVDHRNHCAVCHWIRTARTLRATSVESVANTTASPLTTAAVTTAPRDPGLEKLPARAPPSTLL